MLTPEEISRFYSAHEVTGLCPVCGQNSWAVVEAPKDMSFSIQSQPSTGGLVIGGNANIPMALMVCNNCFSLRFHAEKGIRAWLDAHPDNENSTKE